MPRSALRMSPSRSWVAPEKAPLHVAEKLALDESLRQRAAVDRDERAGAARHGVHRAREQLLAGAGLALDQHRHRRARDLGEVDERAHQVGREAEQPGRRRGNLRGLAVGRERHHRRARPLAVQEEGVAELEQVAVLEHGAVVALAVEDDAVLGAGVLQDPAAQLLDQACVDLRHAHVGHADREQAGAVALGARGATLVRTPHHHLVQLAERMPGGRRKRAVGFEDEVETGAGPLDRVLTTLVAVLGDRLGQLAAHPFSSSYAGVGAA